MDSLGGWLKCLLQIVGGDAFPSERRSDGRLSMGLWRLGKLTGFARTSGSDGHRAVRDAIRQEQVALKGAKTGSKRVVFVRSERKMAPLEASREPF